MRKQEVQDLISACHSFPEIACSTDETAFIVRDNILDTIKSILSGDTQVIVIEGEEGIGKTNILVQFALRNSHNTLSLFIKPTNRWSYDPESLRYDLCNQLSLIVNKEELHEPQDADDIFLRNTMLKLIRLARLNNKTFYFLIDGLHEIPEENSSIRNIILDMLPIGSRDFRFIFTGDSEKLPKDKLSSILWKTFPLTGFTFGETEKFFNQFNITKDNITEIYRNCRHVPGNLAAVKRILQTGVSVEKLLEEMPNTMSDLFEIEWKKIDENNSLQIQLLSILAHDRKKHYINELSQLLDVEKKEVLDSLKNLTFICIDDVTEEVSFVTEAFYKFAAKKLYNKKRYVNKILIDSLIKQPESDIALKYLPGYLEEAERYEDLLDYLSADNFIEMLKKTQSLSIVKQKADLGILTSKRLNRDADLVKFSVQKSIMSELEGSEVWRSEVEARMAINDYIQAVSLAHATELKEDRFHLLAILCKKKKEKGLTIEPELIDQINNLYKEIDAQLLGERAIEIASDLLFTNADLAIELVEKATSITANENKLDWAYAKLSLAALSKSERGLNTDTFQDISSKIKNQGVRDLSRGVKLLIEDYSADELINEVEKLGSADNKLLLIRHWTKLNSKRKDTIKIVEYALNLTIKTTAYAPNANVLNELAIPLPYIDNDEKARQFVGSFDSQKGTIEHVGPTEDYIRLQLTLAKTEYKFNFDAATNRIIEIYLYITELEDLALKALCLAWLLDTLKEIDKELRLEQRDKIHSSVESELDKDLKDLLNTTADHFQLSKRIIRALAINCSDKALRLAKLLNAEYRRDMSLLELIKTILHTDLEKIDFIFLEKVMNEIADIDAQDIALLRILERLAEETTYPTNIDTSVLLFISRIERIKHAAECCRACCSGLTILARISNKKYDDVFSSLLDKLDVVWDSIDVGWHKVDIGFKITTQLSDISIDRAKNFIEKVESFRDEILIDANSTANTYISSIRLAIRAYSGLLPKGIDTKSDFDRLSDLINKLPSYGERAELWADLALRYYINGKTDKCKQIISEHVKPLLNNISENDKYYKDSLIVTLAPALYCGHKLTALEQISKLNYPDRDYAYMNICSFIFSKKPPLDPYDDFKGQGYEVTFEDIVDICYVLNKISTDSMIYHVVKDISSSITNKKNRISSQQITDISDRLTNTMGLKLPDKRNIKHEGYKIAVEAEIARMKRAKTQEWLDLIEKAKLIPNRADKAYLLCIIGAAMPAKLSTHITKVLKEAKETIDELPSIYDRIEHYELFADLCWDIDGILSRECLQIAMKTAIENNNPDYYNSQISIIDLAHRLDPDLASSLASLADDDDARADMRRNLKNQLLVNDLKKSMIEKEKSIKLNSVKDIDYSRAAWKLLGSLNAGRIGTIHSNDIREYIEVISRLRFPMAYPIVAWVIENCIQRYSNSDSASAYLRPMFEVVLQGTELSISMTERTSSQLKRSKTKSISEENSESLVIRPGERELGIQFIKTWFENNVSEYLKICDPYFGPEDIEIIKILQSVNPQCEIYILTSIEHNKKKNANVSYEEAYHNSWTKISDLDPPETEIVFVGTKNNGSSPIHDRWWISKNCGISVGTSFNTLGITKISDISIINEDSSLIKEKEIDQYLGRKIKEHNGEKLNYILFTL